MLPNDLLELRAKTGKSPKEVLYLSNNSTLRRGKLRIQEGWGMLGSRVLQNKDFLHICQCNSLYQHLKKEQALKKCTLKAMTNEDTSVSQSLD